MMMMMDEVKHKSSRSDPREQREKDRNREKHRDRERESSVRRSEKERSVDDNKHREKHRDRDLKYKEEREKDHDRKRSRRDEEDYRERRERERDRSRSDRHRDDDHDEGRRKKSKEDLDIKQKRSREQDLEEEQRKLDEVMDKRRKRVHVLLELKTKKEESEREKKNEPKSGRNWTLEGEESDDGEEEAVPSIKKEENEMAMDEDDPLDAFMNSMALQQVYGKARNKSMGRIMQGEDSDSDYGDSERNDTPREDADEDDDEFTKRVKKPKAEKLSLVDLSTIQYPPFRKNFYIEVKEISRMTFDEVAAYRKQLALKFYGKDVPKPIKTWVQTGLASKILDTIKKHGFEKPMPIQAQALPIIMSGRDCIGVAKTGSGKTLAFVLPMLRHIKDQPPLEQGDGPIGLIIAPTRELVQQIHSDIRKFAKVLNIRSVPVYGGSGVAQQISELKHGTEIVVCTPGRMIDILCKNSGKITNLRRVTYLVMDEADRMFDMGFKPQITHIVQNTRPDRQTVLFSATFPGQVEILARKVLIKPVKMQIGGRNAVNKDITQLVEVRPEKDRFLRLLELLREWCEKGKILIFVHSQEKCDSLFKDLLKHGYLCLSLHGAKDQTDREDTISDFKSNDRNVLIATSIAARGLDVNDLELVINFDVPNHYEEYVHRVGRTGRAGRKGCAITFISENDARYSPDLVKALELSEQDVPGDLKALADGFMAKVNQGLEKSHGTGYGGSGFKFNEEEDEDRKAAKKAQARGHAKDYGLEEDKSDSDSEDEGIRKAGGHLSQQAVLAQAAAIAAASRVPTPVSGAQLLPNGGIPGTLPGVHGLPIPGTAAVLPANGAARAAVLEAVKKLQHNIQKIQQDAIPEHYEAEFEINDFPQNARSKVIKEALGRISEWTGAAITTRGEFCSKGKVPGPGERKLYLFIEGPTESSVKRAKTEVKRVLEDIMR